MTIDDHPREYVSCPECDADAETWQKKRQLPQIGQTYECGSCGHEVHVYDVGGPGETSRQWRPVIDGMAINLLFFDEIGDWPDSALEELYQQGLERMQAIDYHIVKIEGLTQNEWADRTDRAQPSVSENVAKAREKIGDR